MGINCGCFGSTFDAVETSADRSAGTTVQRGNMRCAASWRRNLFAWMATFITGKLAGEGARAQMLSVAADEKVV